MKKTNFTIDLMKLLFSILIVVHHADAFMPIKMRGSVSVEFFLMVSGFLMARKVYGSRHDTSLSLGEDTARFLIKKYMSVFYHILTAVIVSLTLHTIVYQWPAELVRTNVIYSIPDLLCLQMLGYNQFFYATGVSWYISAMLVAMAILYPLLVKYKKNISYIVAPLASLALYGILWHNEGNLAAPATWMGNVVYKGLLRGIGGISLGVVCYEFSSYLAARQYTNGQRIALTVVEYSAWIGSFVLMATIETADVNDFYLVALQFVAVMLCFSEQSLITRWINRHNIPFVREASICIFLNNQYVARVMPDLLPGESDEKRFVVYLGLVLVFSVINHYGAKALSGLVKRFGAAPAKV